MKYFRFTKVPPFHKNLPSLTYLHHFHIAPRFPFEKRKKPPATKQPTAITSSGVRLE